MRTAALIALGWLLASLVTPAAAQQQALRFTVANAEFTLMHEMGHLLISELGLPVLGREEDAADQLGFMGLFLLHGRQHDATFYAKLMDVADYWRLEWRNAERDGDGIALWDSHALDAQRFYNIACLAYGSDPDRLDWVLDVSGLPAERALYCPEEYQQVAHAVRWLRERLQPPAPGTPRHRITVSTTSRRAIWRTRRRCNRRSAPAASWKRWRARQAKHSTCRATSRCA